PFPPLTATHRAYCRRGSAARRTTMILVRTHGEQQAAPLHAWRWPASAQAGTFAGVTPPVVSHDRRRGVATPNPARHVRCEVRCLSNRLQDRVRPHLRRHLSPPVRFARQHRLMRADLVVAGGHTLRRAARCHRPHSLQKLLARLDDRLVRRPQMLLRTIDDPPHALLDRPVLHIDAVYTGVALMALHDAV